MTSPRISIYTDGGCRPNPGPGGWGAVIDGPEGRRELAGSEASSTNNRMELTAAIRALESLPEGTEVELFTDSTYVEQGISRWLAGWRRKGWVTSTKEPVKNRDLWMALDEAARRRRVSWRWARGHTGEPGNERAHELAAAAIPGGAAAARGAGNPLAAPSAETVEAFLAVAWSGKRRAGAWGALLRYRGIEKEVAGRAHVDTSNAAHIASAALALEAIQRPRPVRIVTVSDYLRDGATMWLAAWRRRGWTTRDGKPVKNRAWWERLARQLARLEVEWQVVGEEEPPPELVRARMLAREALG